MEMLPIYKTYLLYIYFIIGTISAYFANKEGKNPYFWFFLGFTFGVFPLIMLFFLKRKKAKTIKPTLKPSLKPSNFKDSRFWYYLDKKNQKFGPISFFKLQSLFLDNKICKNTFVWTENFEGWKYLKDIKEYNLINKTPSTSAVSQ